MDPSSDDKQLYRLTDGQKRNSINEGLETVDFITKE